MPAGVDADARTLPAAPVEADQRQATRWRHATHVRVRSDADTAIAALPSKFIALAATRRIVESFQCRIEAALVISAVVNHCWTVIRPIGEISFLDEILSPHLDLVHFQMTRDRINGALGDVTAFRP